MPDPSATHPEPPSWEPSPPVTLFVLPGPGEPGDFFDPAVGGEPEPPRPVGRDREAFLLEGLANAIGRGWSPCMTFATGSFRDRADTLAMMMKEPEYGDRHVVLFLTLDGVPPRRDDHVLVARDRRSLLSLRFFHQLEAFVEQESGLPVDALGVDGRDPEPWRRRAFHVLEPAWYLRRNTFGVLVSPWVLARVEDERLDAVTWSVARGVLAWLDWLQKWGWRRE